MIEGKKVYEAVVGRGKKVGRLRYGAAEQRRSECQMIDTLEES